jgi:hypothetical protein
VKLEIAGNVGTKRANGVRKSGSAETGVKFFCDGAAADNLTTFENQWLKTALGEIERSDQSIVAAADEGYALSDGHD